MSKSTISEIIFPAFCASVGVPYKAVPRLDDKKTPDFDIELGGNIIVTEIKQLDQNDKDKALFEQFRKTGSAAGFPMTDERLRLKIKEANHQLKARSGGHLPSLLVLYNNGTFGGIDSTDIKTAMFGKEKVVVKLFKGEPQFVTPIHAGGGRKMTEDCNTTISAVGLLRGPIDSTSLTIFHNHFAINPIDPEWFRHERFRHFALSTDCYEWQAI